MRITLIGSGNIASHLGAAFLKAGHRIAEIHGSNAGTAGRLAKKLKARSVIGITDLGDDTDIIVIAVPDREIKSVVTALPLSKKPVAHTSGTIPIDVFPSRFLHAGIFYPLQTLTKGTNVRFREIPICIESRSKKARAVLSDLGKSVSEKVVEMGSEERTRMHLAAVMVNNFSNHLFHLAEELVTSRGLDFTLLHPLIRETTRKATMIGPAAAQTGPARRGDTAVIKKHIALLGPRSRNADIYRILTESIEAMHGPKL